MSFLAELKERRLVQVVAATAGAAWLVLEVVDQLSARGVVPEFVYRLALLWGIGAVAVALILGWYHGEKGRQRVSQTELAYLAGIGVTVAVFSVSTVSQGLAEGGRVDRGGEGGMDPRAIAVLYFEDLSADGEGRAAADALTEVLVHDLSSERSLRVAGTAATLPLRGASTRTVPVDSVARALGVGTVLAGSAEPVGRRIRVNVRLLDGVSGVEVGRQAFEREADDPAGLREQLVGEAAQLLSEWLQERTRIRAGELGTESAAAWWLHQRGNVRLKEARGRLEAGAPAAAARSAALADSLFALAASADPLWIEPALQRAAVAHAAAEAAPDPQTRAVWIDRGLAGVERALGVDPDDARGLVMRGALRHLAYRLGLWGRAAEGAALLDGARSDLEAAVGREPGLAEAHAALSRVYEEPSQNALRLAAVEALQAYELDPHVPRARELLARLFTMSFETGDLRQAERWCAEGGRRFAGEVPFLLCRLQLMTVPSADPDPSEAREVAGAIGLLPGVDPEGEAAVRTQLLVAAILARAGLPDSARAVLPDPGRVMSLVPGRHALVLDALFTYRLLGDLELATRVVLEGDEDPAVLERVYRWRWVAAEARR